MKCVYLHTVYAATQHKGNMNIEQNKNVKLYSDCQVSINVQHNNNITIIIVIATLTM